MSRSLGYNKSCFWTNKNIFSYKLTGYSYMMTTPYMSKAQGKFDLSVQDSFNVVILQETGKRFTRFHFFTLV